MRFSAITAVCAAPLVLAGRGLHARSPVAGEQQVQQGQGQQRPPVPVQHNAPVQQQHPGNAVVVPGSKGHQVISGTTIVVIWVNQGGGAPANQIQPPPVAPQATHTVKVGGPAGLVYQPEELKAAVGDMIVFEFLSKNHTVTQSPFETPCQKIEGGLDSDFIANADNAIVPPPQMAMQVTTDKPLWFYCRQSGHCGKGMVFSVNPTAEKTHAQFKQKAIEQNGGGATPPIAGGPPGAAPPPGGAAPPPPPPAAAPPAGSAPPNQVAPPPGMATGIGNVGGDGACSCSCLCGVASFPNPLQGRGHWGGMTGAIPMAALEK